MNIEEAKAIAVRAHQGQTDKSGRPYTEHVFGVEQIAHQICENFEDLMTTEEATHIRIAALLHDVIEDTDVTAEELLGMGVPERSVNTIIALSRPNIDGKNVPYMDWIRSLADGGDVHAIVVKLADNVHNSHPERLASLPPESQGLSKRYAKARDALLDGLEKAVVLLEEQREAKRNEL